MNREVNEIATQQLWRKRTLNMVVLFLLALVAIEIGQKTDHHAGPIGQNPN
jgi:hypothetical protein